MIDVILDQSTWNLLFGWTGKQCMIPEGCSPPLEGVAVYVALLAAVVAAAIYYKEDIEIWKR